MIAAGVLGVVMIAAGVVVLLRAAAAVRADLVAKLINIEFGAHRAQPRSRGWSRSAGRVAEPKSFEEELAALNDEMGRRPE